MAVAPITAVVESALLGSMLLEGAGHGAHAGRRPGGGRAEAGRERLQRAGVLAERVEGCVVSAGGTVYTEVLDSGRT